jgi:hypothetical protein
MKKQFSATDSAALDKTKIKSLLGIVLLSIWLIAAISPAYCQEVSTHRVFLKSGKVVECDEAWIASEDIIRCKKASGTILYSIDEVDLQKSFGAGFRVPLTEKPGKEGERAEKKPPRTFAKAGFPREPQIRFGPVFSAFNYKEPGLMELDGMLYGVKGSYTQWSENGLGVTLSLSYDFGPDTDYTGSTWGGTPVTAEADDHILEFRGLVAGWNLFAGIGYRYWHNEVKASGGYEREISYWYVPVGINVSAPLSERWTGRINAEYDLFISGTVTSYLSQAVAGSNDPENEQDSGYGYRFSVEFKRELEELYALSIEPFFIYWDIDESDWALLTQYGVPIGYVYEPENETKTYGIAVTLYF